ncbi:MAG: glutamate--tRNA ligase [Leptonema sp. (in: Bacteria)]|nr:glutamate--tRNA ligase [Leptonema sp. (in: bacteria)]
MTEIRTRFAPSPSGYLHIGGARTALFNYLYAKAMKGSFVVRVEDTDQDRSTPESEQIILDSLEWLGIKADEGVREGGNYGPYRQSERLNHYQPYTEKLLKEKKAYPCFCTDEELEAKQERSRKLGLPHVYDGKCRNLSQEEIDSKIAAGLPHAYRFKIEPNEITVHDLVQGNVKFDSKLIGDFVIVKSDGFPSYNYAVVIDDHEMKISHVIRGVGHLSNTPRQILIHEALGLTLPKYAHISEIVGTDRKKLSKRRGATSVLFFKDLGYLSEGLVNYMALLGWYPEDAIEFMPNGELEQKFNVERCSKSPAMFDFFQTSNDSDEFDPTKLSRDELLKIINPKSKLNWLNQKYIRHFPINQVWSLALPFLKKDAAIAQLLNQDPDKVHRAFDSMRDYIHTLEDAAPFIKEIFRSKIEYDSIEAKEMASTDSAKKVIETFIQQLEETKPSSPDEFTATIKETGKIAGEKGKSLFMPIRAATTGSLIGLELNVLFSLLSWQTVKERARIRLDNVS